MLRGCENSDVNSSGGQCEVLAAIKNLYVLQYVEKNMGNLHLTDINVSVQGSP